MSSQPQFPRYQEPIAGRELTSGPWYSWFQRIDGLVSAGVLSEASASAAIVAISTALGSPDGTPGNIPTLNFLSKGTRIVGSDRIDVTGTLAGGRVDLDLAELADTGIGAALWKFSRDDYGRVAGTEASTTDDLTEGTTNLYFTNARADARIDAQKGVAGGLATLDGSAKLDAGQLPALSITETFVVASEAAMLLLTAQQGDVAVRTDEQKTYILIADPASTLSNWQELLFPTAGAVTSFNGRTGAVVPASGDYTAAQVGADPAGTAAAIVAASITDGDAAHAPSGDAVFDALALKADSSALPTYGSYTPTVTAETNVSTGTGQACYWVRHGNTIFVTGRIDVIPTGAGAVVARASLPVASNFGSFTDAGGLLSVAGTGITKASGAVNASASSDTLRFSFDGQNTSSHQLYFHVAYQVI